MLRRLSLCAALAALTAPALLAGPAGADPGTAPGASLAADPAAQTVLRKQQPLAVRAPVVSRRAGRQRSEDDAPLSISIDQLTPSTIPAKGVIRISGTVTNNDTVTWSTINIRPFISATPLTTPDQLAEAAQQPADAVVGDRINDERHKDFVEELAPGDSVPYTLTVPRELLNVSTPGVYWFGVHALGESPDGRDENADGRARTFLPLVPPARPGIEPTALVIPLRHQLTYTDDGRVDDLADWVQTLSPDGRLRSLVDFGASSGDRTVSWVVDPAVVDAVRRLADGNPPRSLAPNLQADQLPGEDQGDAGDVTQSAGEGGTGDESSSTASPSEEPSPTESTEAQEPPTSPLDLDELDPVVQAAAQLAQAWLDRLAAAMRPEDQVLTLPYGDVDVAAAAVHDPPLLQRAVTRSSTPLPGFDIATSPVVASPGGYLNAQGIAATDPSSTLIVSDAMFDPPAPGVAEVAGHQLLVASTGAAAGGPGPDSRTATTAMRQRLLSEAAVRFLRGGRAPLTMVVPHDWNPSAGGGSFFSGLDAPWLDLTSVNGIRDDATAVPVADADLDYPRWQEELELTQPSFDAAEQLIRSGVALQNLLTLNNIVSGTVTDEALGTTSYSARTRPIANRTAADASRKWIADRLAMVKVSTPSAVTLSSSSGRFQATISNELDQPVTVALDARAEGKLTIDGPRRVEVPARRRLAVLLTARTDENGIHEVTLAVTDKRGTPLGATTDLTIRSAQVSNLIWLFLATGSALLFGAIGVRLFRRVRRSRSGSAGDPGAGEDAATVHRDGHKEPAGAGSR